MAARREIREFDLLEYARCLIRRPEKVPYVRAADVLASELAAKKALLGVFDKGYPAAAATFREWYEAAWRETVGFDPELKTPPRSGWTAVRRLRDVLLEYEIWQPATKYVLNLGRAAVSGEYAVLAPLRRRKRDALYLVRWRHKGETALEASDVVSYARWLHLRNMEGSDITVLNISLDKNEVWSERPAGERPVRDALAYLVDSILNEQSFPNPGPHCKTCHTHACGAKVFATPDKLFQLPAERVDK